MGKKIVWLVLTCLMVLSLLAASCAPTTQTTQTPTTTTTTTSTPTAPTGAVTTTPATSTVPAGPEMVNVTLKKLDGTTVEKTIEKPKYGGELIVERQTAITGWDEGLTAHYTMSGNIDNIMEKLIEGDWSRGASGTEEVTWQLSGWFNLDYSRGFIAESWEIKEPDTITFNIREGVHFSLNRALEASRLVGGRELTADDVVKNIRRVFFDIKTAGQYATAGDSRPTDVYAADKSTVVVKVPPGQIWFAFEYVSAWTNIYPPEVWQKYGDCQDWTRAIGTDAFMLTDYVAMSSVTYAKNQNYWGKDPTIPENQVPYVDTVKLLIIPDTSTRLSAIRTGKIDVVTAVSWEDAASLKKSNPDLQYSRYLASVILPTGRQDKPDLPFKDINVRRALMMAINLQQIKDTYYGGEAILFSYPAPPTKEWTRAFTPLEELGPASDGFDTKKIYQYNPTEAEKLLAQAGYPDGFKSKIIIASADADLASIVKAFWADIGVELTLDVKESSVKSTILARKSHEEMFWHGYSNAGLFYNWAPNRSGQLYNPSMSTDAGVLERYNKLSGLQPLTNDWWNLVKETNVYVVHLVNYFPLPQPYVMVFWQPWLKNYHGEISMGMWNGQSWDRYIWIDQDLKRSMGR